MKTTNWSMNRRMNRRLIVLAFASLITVGISVSRAADEFQIWLDTAISGNLTDHTTLKVNEQLKFKDNAGDFALYHTDVGVTRSTKGPWKAGLNLRQEYEKKNGEWLEETRLHGHVTYGWKWNNISLSNRNRLELRLRDGRSDIVRYRNKLTATFPVTLGNTGLKPYWSEELFIDSDEAELNRSRMTVGLKTKLKDRYSVGTYYMWQADDKTSWVSSHILGFKAGLKF